MLVILEVADSQMKDEKENGGYQQARQEAQPGQPFHQTIEPIHAERSSSNMQYKRAADKFRHQAISSSRSWTSHCNPCGLKLPNQVFRKIGNVSPVGSCEAL